MKYVTYTIGGTLFATSLENIQEIIKHPTFEDHGNTLVKHVGMINIRDKVIAVFDGRELLGTDNQDEQEHTILVCLHEGSAYGIMVDDVHEIIDIESNKIEAGSTEFMSSEYIKGVHLWNGNVITLLDFSPILQN